MDQGFSTNRSEQSTQAYCDHVVYAFAAMFRAFCAQEGVTREEALELTKTVIYARESAMTTEIMRRGAK